jgi:ribonuclease HII
MPKPLPTLDHESARAGLVAGIDEAGRGPWAGPVVAAAVIATPALAGLGITDSKQLSPARRSALAQIIQAVTQVGVGIASVEEIDQLNILRANDLAMARAVSALPQQPSFCLIDGNRVPALTVPAQALVGGDRLSLSIAAASIVAKVTRDALMDALHVQFPAYGWNSNRGYGTAVHQAALEHCGPTLHHRRSFAPVARVLTRYS